MIRNKYKTFITELSLQLEKNVIMFDYASAIWYILFKYGKTSSVIWVDLENK